MIASVKDEMFKVDVLIKEAVHLGKEGQHFLISKIYYLKIWIVFETWNLMNIMVTHHTPVSNIQTIYIRCACVA